MVSGCSAPSRAFMRELRNALHHLYLPDQLRSNPLLSLFHIEPREGPAGLRRVLLEAIDTLKPGGDVPRHAKPWRMYSALLYLYVRQFSQAEVATSFSLSTRQLRRLEFDARQALAENLWAQYALDGRTDTDLEPGTPSHEQELAWMARSAASEPVRLHELLETAVRTAAPLAAAHEARVRMAVSPSLPRVMVQTASMRQALLEVLTAMIQQAPHCQVCIEAEAGRGELRVRFRRTGGDADGAAAGQERLVERMELVRGLIALSGGESHVALAHGAGQETILELALPAAGQLTVLVLEDNADTQQLLRRYLAGSRYLFLGACTAEQALELARETSPHIIVLDIMMPDVDGWEALGRLRTHPSTRDTPVIVCSILAEEELALALGAAGFLRKPVSRSQFLAALDCQAECLAPRSG